MSHCHQNKQDETKELMDKYIEAAEQGDAEAQFQLGKLYGLGKYAEEEMIEWYTKAAERGDKYAQEWLQRCGYNLPEVIE